MQLVSNRGAAVLEHVKAIGVQHKLNMLPVLKKPFETEAVVKILHGLKLGMPTAAATRLSLDEALDNKWIEFWYQQKIDLRKKQLAGAEAYARARHPQHGIVMPEAFTPGASETAILKLSQLVLDDFGRGHESLARLGELPFAELKIDRAFVADCGTDKVNAPLCKTVIDLAHNFGRAAVAVGLEKAADAMALVSMGCDFGQGSLLGQPMPEERFISLLRQRAATQGRDLPATAAR